MANVVVSPVVPTVSHSVAVKPATKAVKPTVKKAEPRKEVEKVAVKEKDAK
jgi:hypothetical protein